MQPGEETMPKAIDEAFVLDTVTRLRGEVPASFAVEPCSEDWD